jgi:UDP-GlcNAc:undecaprenyl-phosphate GlcNAc-1-phosphate transferase
MLSFIIADLFTPILRRIALLFKAIDKGDTYRKIHKIPTPTLGGISIFAAFYIPLIGLLIYENKISQLFTSDYNLVVGLFTGGAIIFALGILDDLKEIKPLHKLAVQILAATTVYYFGFRIVRLSIPFYHSPLELGFFGYFITLFWIVGITNAINLIDGSDGLAAGISIFVVLNLLITSILNNSTLLILFSLALLGGLIGFLRYNFPPAKIFMGDTGSQFVGFIISILAISEAQKGATTVALLSPIIVLGIPIIDTFLAIARRVIKGVSIFEADFDHIHHRLIKKGFSRKKIAIYIYIFCLILWILSMIVIVGKNVLIALVLILMLITFWFVTKKLGYLDELKLSHSNGRLLKRLLNKKLLRVNSSSEK